MVETDIDPDLLCLGCLCDNPAGAYPCRQCSWSFQAQPRLAVLEPGSILAGYYLMGRVLGYGDYGITYAALDLARREKVAVKEFYPRSSVGREADGETVLPRGEAFNSGLQTFLECARTWSSLSQPGLIALKALEANRTGYLVMPFLRGKTLGAWLEDQGGRVPFHQAMELLRPVMGGLQTLHERNCLHLDVCPDHVWVDGQEQALLFEFGAAREVMRGLRQDVEWDEMPFCAAPEQFAGQTGPACDQYGLAATFYRAVTGEAAPLSASRAQRDTLRPPSHLGVHLPPGMEAVLLKALAIRPEDRFASLAELEAGLLGGIS